ncbi:hypothetical protein I4J48_12315 [Pseudonocardia sp. KRD-169]|uniref:Uncharacterized protein n=1 Tax=Pseudonocardia abyssalis TaxID=2792008 RepID=A0ABS6UNP8_9PSEU|nr:hypothetical protein [Pseudonocardia abyssalis]MBW0133882.1 hypothetical protein [Pseudonocardia abyssalis]
MRSGTQTYPAKLPAATAAWTSSPGRNPVTAAPTVATRPVTSRPVTSRPVTSRPVTSRPVTSRPRTATRGPRSPSAARMTSGRPEVTNQSPWFTAAACTRPSTSWGPGVGSSTSCRRRTSTVR